MSTHETQSAHIAIRKTEGMGIDICFSGAWPLEHMPASHHAVLQEMSTLSTKHSVRLLCEDLGHWGSTLITSIVAIISACRKVGIEPDSSALPEGVQRLVRLAFAVPPREGTERQKSHLGFFEHIGDAALTLPHSIQHVAAFCRQVSVGLCRVFCGQSDMRWRDVLAQVQECGSTALPIVSLISLLVGLILAFVGAVQLQTFGAEIYVADLVGIGMVRVIGAIMAAITMAGRTGASFAAVLGTMQVNEEIDALRTLGVSPTEFLVLPRLIALVAMMPLLTIYADAMGILGGLIVGVGMLDLNMAEYVFATKRSHTTANIWIGLVHATFFGLVIAICGCYNGIRCGRSALAVGVATTAAVVSSIVSIIVVTAIITVVCDGIGV